MFQRRKTPNLNIHDANSTLQNVFEACHVPPNTIPFDKIVLREKANTKYFNVCITICGLFLILTLLLPIPFILIDHTVNNPAKNNSIQVINDYMESDILYLKLSTALNYEKCYLTQADGTQVAPVSYDSLEYIIAFPYYDEEVSIYLENISGSTSATAIISPK